MLSSPRHQPEAHRPPAPFVVGVERSGTTLLRLQLDAHPELAIPPETGVGRLVARLGTNAQPHELLAALRALANWEGFGLGQQDLAAAFDDLPEWSPREGLRWFYGAYAARHGKSRWGDKTPLHIEYIGELASLFPEAHFVHLIRDGRDVAASVRGLPFAPGEGSIEEIARAWQSRVAAARRLGAAVPHYREIRYERLVREPEATLRELCNFLDLDFSDSMLHSHETARDRLAETVGVEVRGDEALFAQGGQSVTAHTPSPPDPSRTGRWRDALSSQEVKRFEAVAGGALSALGYERSVTSSLRPSAEVQAQSSDGNEPMRIVIGVQAFARAGGTQTYVFTVARELQRLGHDTLITAEEIGAMADFAESSGLPVARTTADLPPTCDAIFAQDAIAAARLLDFYPEARLVQFAHSDVHDHQLPVLVPDSVDAVVVASDRLARRIRAMPVDAQVVRLRQPIDTQRFTDGGPIPPRPTRALILSNYLRGDRRRALVDAWKAAGVECVQVGLDKPRVDVVSAIGEADIVVGKARAALEGMSRARAVYLYDEFGGDGWITTETYPAMEADAFAGLALADTRTPADMSADLDLYRPEMGPLNRELIRRHHSATRHAAALVEVLRGSRPVRPRGATTLSEVGRLTRSAWYWEKRASRAEGRRVEAERARAQAEKRAREAEREARRLGRVLGTRRVRAGLLLGRALDKLKPSR